MTDKRLPTAEEISQTRVDAAASNWEIAEQQNAIQEDEPRRKTIRLRDTPSPRRPLVTGMGPSGNGPEK